MTSDLDHILKQLALLNPAEQYRDLLEDSNLDAWRQAETVHQMSRHYQHKENANRALVNELTAGFRLDELARQTIKGYEPDALQSIAKQFEIDRLLTISSYAEKLRDSAATDLALFRDGALKSLLDNLPNPALDVMELQRIGGVAELSFTLDQFKDIAGISTLEILAKGHLEGGRWEEVDYEDDDDEVSEQFDPLPEEFRPALIEFVRVPLALYRMIEEHPDLMHQWIANPLDLEQLIAQLLDEAGADEVFLTPRSGDKGIDIFATYRQNGSTVLVACECKKWNPRRRIGPSTARDFIGALVTTPADPSIGILATTSGFGPDATSLLAQKVQGKSLIELQAWGPKQIAEFARSIRQGS